MWCSARRYGATQEQLLGACAEAGRDAPTFAGLNMWVGLGADPNSARARLGERMSTLYNLPPEKFQHTTAAGRPEEVAGFLSAYVEAGARTITLVPVADDVHTAIELSGEVRRLLAAAPVPV
jgi:alkanesulfonate monooxygenase SsuD/methylene tetrahydromethanopterin reductase-like flavin-dependent oxidoreductase (luciferase family)